MYICIVDVRALPPACANECWRQSRTKVVASLARDNVFSRIYSTSLCIINTPRECVSSQKCDFFLCFCPLSGVETIYYSLNGCELCEL